MKSQWELLMQNINVLIPLLVKRTEMNLNIKKKKKIVNNKCQADKKLTTDLQNSEI